MSTYLLLLINQFRISILLFILGGILFIFIWKRNHSSILSPFSSILAGAAATSTLNSYTTDFTELARLGRIDPVIGRQEQVIHLAQILSRRNKNNAILVGPPGVGKTAIVEALAQRIINHEVPEVLLNKRVLSLDVATLLSGTKYRGEFEQRAKRIVEEISNAKRSIILFIDEIHSVIQSRGTEGAVNLSDILKPALARGDLQMVGATTIEEYNAYIKTDPSLERRFQPLKIEEPSLAETIAILQGVKEKYATYHRVAFTDAAIEVAVRVTKEKILNRLLPDKAIDAIDEAAAMVKVSQVNKAVAAVLYQTAVDKHPEVAEKWKKIQAIDEQIRTSDPPQKPALIKARENLEEQIQTRGVVTVDSQDVADVIQKWSESL